MPAVIIFCGPGSEKNRRAVALAKFYGKSVIFDAVEDATVYDISNDDALILVSVPFDGVIPIEQALENMAREAVIEAAFNAMEHCERRTLGDGTMHVARGILAAAINNYDREVAR